MRPVLFLASSLATLSGSYFPQSLPGWPISVYWLLGIIATLLVPALDVPLPDLGRAVPSGSAVQALLEVMQGEGSALLDWVAADEQGPGELSRALAEHFCRYVRRHNQYLELGLDHRALLAELARQSQRP